jgi:hypothetical protein
MVNLTPEPEPPPVSHPAEVTAGLVLALLANLVVVASLATLLAVEAGARIRPMGQGLGTIFGIVLGLLGLVSSAAGLRDQGLSGRLAWGGVFLGLLPFPVAFVVMRLVIWYKAFDILP